jgi:uncharacterized protein (TIGR02246 family)
MARSLRYCLVLSVAFAWVGIAAADAPQANPEQAAITKQAQAFVDAFQKGDANAVAAFWVPDGSYTDVDGRELVGRKAIAQEFAKFFADSKGQKLRIDVQSTRFPTPDVAIEEGTSTVIPGDQGLPERVRYSNVLVRKDGQWMLASVCESPYIPPSNYDHLKSLEWLVGEWSQEAKDSHVARISFDFTPDQNFLVGERVVAVKNTLMGSGSERIGWDPAAKTIRSWSFENNGGFGQGTWKTEGDKWVISTNYVQANGAAVTATTTLTRVDPDTVTLQAKVQPWGAKTTTDMPAVTLKRVKVAMK